MPDIGPHLLGRKPNVPDDRDWTPDQLHAHLGLHPTVGLHASLMDNDPSILDKTIRQAVTERDPFVTTWKGILALWKLIKTLLFPPTPIPTPTPTPTPSTDVPAWEDKVTLDQGNYGTCVGNGWAGFLAAAPIEDAGVNEKLARAIYFEATCIGGQCDDPDAQGGGQAGSTVRDGAKAIQKRGKLTAYAFVTTLDGTAVMGTNWYRSMFTPDAKGWLTISGPLDGGHCYLCVDKLDAEDGYEFVNSWGDWGPLRGRFRMKTADVARLLSEQGDICLAAEV